MILKCALKGNKVGCPNKVSDNMYRYRNWSDGVAEIMCEYHVLFRLPPEG